MKLDSLNLDVVTEQAVLQAIETAVVDYFNVHDCIVNLKTHQACVLFNPYRHKQWIQRFNGDDLSDTTSVPVSIPLERLPIKIIRAAQPLLEELIAEHNTIEDFLKFRSRRGEVVEGTVTESDGDHCKVSLVGGTAILHKREAVQSESYTLGKSFLFLIKQVHLCPDRVEISLSRRSRKIPEFVLTERFPKYQFTCFRRIPGDKSWIKTTAPRYHWGRFVKRDIRKALAGEYLQFHN